MIKQWHGLKNVLIWRYSGLLKGSSNAYTIKVGGTTNHIWHLMSLCILQRNMDRLDGHEHMLSSQ